MNCVVTQSLINQKKKNKKQEIFKLTPQRDLDALREYTTKALKHPNSFLLNSWDITMIMHRLVVFKDPD